MANLTAPNLGRYMQDPRSQMYGNMIKTGTSGEPVQSWQEGLARALQAPLGAYMQQGVRGEYETKQAEAEAKKREAMAALMGEGGFKQAMPILAQDPETSDLALSTALAHAMKEKQGKKVVYQQDAQGNWVGLPETMPESGEITPIQTGITGKMKGETDLEFYQRDPSGFAKYKALGNKGAGGGGSPYFTPVQTAQGVMAFNARTGRMEPVVVSGAPVVGSASDPSLQGNIAREKAAGKIVGEKGATAMVDLPSTIQESEQTIKLVDDLLKHPGFKQAVGGSSALGVQKIPGTDAKAFMTRLEQLKGKQFLQAFQGLKGGGQITEAEGQKATAAISRMDNATTEQEFVAASREFQDVIRNGVKRAKEKSMVGGVGVSHDQGQVQKTPKAGTIKDGYKFNGGNPADPASWIKVQ